MGPDQIAPLRAEDLPVAPVHEAGEGTVGAGSLVMADDRPRLQQDTLTAGEADKEGAGSPIAAQVPGVAGASVDPKALVAGIMPVPKGGS